MSASLDLVRHYLAGAIAFNDLTRRDWRRQTDAVQIAFVAARLLADLPGQCIFVDGHINDFLKHRALNYAGGVKAFFNARFHDAGFKARRIVAYDTFTTKRMGRRGSGKDKLHFHALIEKPPGWSNADMLRLLERVFGRAAVMGRRQFHLTPPRADRHHSHNEVRVEGPLGKMMYVFDHVGATYRDLDLNDGKRSRSTSLTRGRCNRQARRLARGIPSNFLAAVVFCDIASKKAGKETFDAWVRAEKGKPTSNTPPASPHGTQSLRAEQLGNERRQARGSLRA